ncbi:hypothetical protein AZE42_01339 [Rhizopogon vesiculosus]|uniref:Uncharacterized protein n=1 Tax=Rhizopogon vesiculosus TaxID=180088 RepID=A0A1J8PYL4_9AGAM|nr:hypothetical protein AZE42_01339 [Rhizopogon vesiculosus]
MQCASKDLTIRTLRRTTDFKHLTFRIGGFTEEKDGHFYHLWKDGEVLSIQAEPYRPPGIDKSPSYWSNFSSEREAFLYLQEVLQTMLDQLKFGTENNWAHLVRQKDNTFSLIYTRKEFVHLRCPVWTKKVNLDDIEVTRIVSCELWEGIHEGTEVDLFMGVNHHWAHFVAFESLGHKLMNEAGVSHYTFKLLAHVYKSGMVIGVMCEPIIGRRICATDRAAVFEAVADIQRHGILLGSLRPYDILITPNGVRFLNISAVEFYRDHGKLAEFAEQSHWSELAKTFGPEIEARCPTLASRARDALSYIIPRLPSPGRPVYTIPDLDIMRFVWSIMTSPDQNDYPLLRFREQQRRRKSAITDGQKHRRRPRFARQVHFAPLDYTEDRFEVLDETMPVDEPFNPKRRSSHFTPYERRKKKLLLPRDDE